MVDVRFTLDQKKKIGALDDGGNADIHTDVVAEAGVVAGVQYAVTADMMSLEATRHLWLSRLDPRRRSFAVGTYTHVLDQWGIVYDQPIVLNKRRHRRGRRRRHLRHRLRHRGRYGYLGDLIQPNAASHCHSERSEESGHRCARRREDAGAP